MSTPNPFYLKSNTARLIYHLNSRDYQASRYGEPFYYDRELADLTTQEQRVKLQEFVSIEFIFGLLKIHKEEGQSIQEAVFAIDYDAVIASLFSKETLSLLS